MKFTIFGGKGFIGKNFAKYLKLKKHDVFVPVRNGSDAMGQELGHVIYAVGLTGDFRTKPFATVDAHVCLLSQLLQQTKFDSWLYLSSTRVYGGLDSSCRVNEDTSLSVCQSVDSLYDISKLMGESLCLAQQSPRIRIARLSNVYGLGQSEHTFLSSVLSDLVSKGRVTIQESPESAKDYISLSDVLLLLEKIALTGQERVYNVASGVSVTHQDLVDQLSKFSTGLINFREQARMRKFPDIDVSRIKKEFLYSPLLLQDYLSDFLNEHSDLTKEQYD